jgi:membrane protease YdiL (CAAX protease family)
MDPSEPTSSPAPQPPLAPAPPAPIYCSTCGSRLTESGACELCTARPTQPALDHKVSAAPVKAALWLYFLFLFSTIAGMGLIAILGRTHRAIAIGEFTIEAADTLLVTIACLIGWRYVRPALATIPSPRWFLIAAAVSPATFLLAHGIVSGLVKLLSIKDINYLQDLRLAGFHNPFAIALLTICVQPAIVEELAFRGFIFGSLRRILDGREAILVSALLFAIMHLSPLSFVHLAILGIALGWLRERTGSVYPGMLLHFCHNFLVILSEHWR